MQFSELKAQVKGIGLGELRADEDNYLEVVVTKDKLEGICRILESFLGPPVWPPEIKLSSQIEDAIRGFGGISVGQTLYYCNEGSDTVFCMLWPWGDRNHITLKIVKK